MLISELLNNVISIPERVQLEFAISILTPKKNAITMKLQLAGYQVTRMNKEAQTVQL